MITLITLITVRMMKAMMAKIKCDCCDHCDRLSQKTTRGVFGIAFPRKAGLGILTEIIIAYSFNRVKPTRSPPLKLRMTGANQLLPHTKSQNRGCPHLGYFEHLICNERPPQAGFGSTPAPPHSHGIYRRSGGKRRTVWPDKPFG